MHARPVTVFLLSALLPMSIVLGQIAMGDPDPPPARIAGQVSFAGFGGAGMPMGPEYFTNHYEVGIGFICCSKDRINSNISNRIYKSVHRGFHLNQWRTKP